ncbi:MAG TPA: hypothetical protein VF085_12135 [Solirubrobacterales bacterium]
MTKSDDSPQYNAALTSGACTLDDGQLEHAVLMEIINLHPNRPTRAELHLAMSNFGGDPSSQAIDDSLWALRRFGLVRENGDVLEPTLAAVHASELFQLG